VIRLPGAFPPVPEPIRRRFAAEGERWDQDIARWWRTTTSAFNDFGRSNADATNAVVAQTEDIILTQDGFTVALEEERTARIDEDEALGRWLISVSAIASSSQNINVQSTAPGSPSLGDLWVDSTDITDPITRYWDGAAWVEQTSFVLAAAVAEERTARVTADGFLEGKYTLTVTAGSVVTGLNITSSTGTGTDISSVVFRATDFKIHNSVTGVTMFDVSGTTVRLGGTLVVNTTGNKVYIGTGNYGNANTSWYVDSTGIFSLKDKLTWDGTTLTITGSITATTGTIGGWTIGATTISANNAVLDSAGQLVLGTSNDVIILSATNATYRAWVGNASAGSAKFSVTKEGVLFANDATIAGTFVASDDPAYPTWQGGTLATRGVFNQRSGGVAPAYAGLGFSTSTLFEANIAAGSYASKTAVTGTDVGLLLNTRYYNGSSWVGGSGITIKNDASVSGTSFASSYIQFSTVNTTAGTSLWRWQSDGVLVVGASIFTMDTNLYRSAANTWTTDDSLVVGGSLTVTGAFSPSSISTGTISGTTITASSGFSGPGSSITALNATQLTSGTVPDARFPATLPAASGVNLTALNATNISSGTLANARLPSAISVTSLATANFEASVGSAVDVKDVNFRVYSGATQNARIDYTTGFYYVQGNQVVGARGTKGAATITEVVALLDAWGAWA
jgi:hypothetical protein